MWRVSDLIQTFCWFKYWQGRSSLFIFLRHLGFTYFPITTGFLVSPVAETKKATVNCSFDFLPPLHFFAISERLYPVVHGNSSQFQPCSRCLASRIQRLHCRLRHISRFTTEFMFRKAVVLFKSCKPACRRLELRVPKFLCYFPCELLDKRTIDWNGCFGFLLEPFPYSSIHIRVLWSTVMIVRTRKSFLTRVFCFRMLLTCVFPQPNLWVSLRTPVRPLLFSYSSRIWKRFCKGSSFLAFHFVSSFGMIERYGLQ